MSIKTFKELHPPPMRAFRHIYSLSNGRSCKFCGMTPQEYEAQERQAKLDLPASKLKDVFDGIRDRTVK